MAFTTLSVRVDVARRLRLAKQPGESFSDTLDRLLENQPAKNVGEWLDSLQAMEGHAIYTPARRAQLRADQRTPRPSARRRRAGA
jgi:predicted CopG family antitoxin